MSCHKLLLPPGLCAVMLVSPATLAGIEIRPVAPEAAAAWAWHVTPLPREMTIQRKVITAPGEVSVVAPAQADPVIEQALAELRECLGSKRSPAEAATASFAITLQLGGAESKDLEKLKNADQTYRIFPDEPGQKLRLVALSSRGLYYAAKTLQHLIRARAATDRIEIPLASVTDWPELEDRGLWGADAYLCLPWLADRKINYIEHIAAIRVDQKSGRGHGSVKPGCETLLTLAPRLGIEHVPVILHLEQLSGKGLFEAYPELRAQGGKPGAICYSKPAIVKVLADWMVELGSLPGVDEVDVWLAENLGGKGGCQCDDCKKVNRSVLETRVVLAAWKEALQRKGKLGLRVLTSEETYRHNAEVFAEIPPEVKIWYYHSLLTYTAREAPMIAGPVEKLARAGRWMGVCPSLVAHVGFPEPFTGAQFIHYRLTEFARRNLSGMLGYATPRTRFARFNVEAAAEWAWNPAGRTPREFAFSWAVREKLKDPEKFAAWSELIGPVAWDVYGSEWPAGEKRTSQETIAPALVHGRLPELGTFKWGLYGSPWGDIKSEQQLKEDVKSAAQALKLARELGVPEFIQESLVIEGYVNALHALWQLKQVVHPEGIATENREAARRSMEDFLNAMGQSKTALIAWEKIMSRQSASGSLIQTPLKTINTTMDQMKAARATLKLE